MSQTLKRYSLISFAHEDGIDLYEKVYVDPSATPEEHETKLQEKLAEINSLFGVTKFTVSTTYEYEVDYVDPLKPVVEAAPDVTEAPVISE